MSDTPEVSPARDRPGAPPASGTGLRVLVVDDEPAVLAVLAEMLARLGCGVVTARTAEQAPARLGVEPVDLVLSDIRESRLLEVSRYDRRRANGRVA